MSTNDIGTKFYIATGLPAAFTEAGYEAMTWTEVKGLQTIGEVGDDHASISVEDLTSGRTKTLKGAVTGTNSAVAFREIVGDAGQTAMKAACGSRDEYSFKIDEPGTALTFLSGVAMNYKRRERSVTSHAGFTASVTSNYDIVYGTD